MVQVVGRRGRRRLPRGSVSDRRPGLFAAALTVALALGACTSSGGGSGSNAATGAAASAAASTSTTTTPTTPPVTLTPSVEADAKV
ncbi:MAG TPA: hypothetical protein VNS83_00440, partial [Lapillicoccus sp.]|nr:hypothetical protein [Lapillicoccus sp.]